LSAKAATGPYRTITGRKSSPPEISSAWTPAFRYGWSPMRERPRFVSGGPKCKDARVFVTGGLADGQQKCPRAQRRSFSSTGYRAAQKPQRPVFRVSMYNPLVRRWTRDVYPFRMSKIHAPICPRCNQPMTWDRTLPAFGPALPDLHSFYCDTCGHAETLAFLAQPTARHSIARVAGAKN